MSDISSISDDDEQQPQRNANGGRQMDPPVDMPPAPPPTTRRILVISNQVNIITVLAAFAWGNRQPIYVMSGRGFVSHATLSSIPAGEQMIYAGRGQILYLSGWFLPINPIGRNFHGKLHASLSGVQGGVALVHSLFTSGPVELEVMFVCGPGSYVQPIPPGAPREQMRLQVNVPPQRLPGAQ